MSEAQALAKEIEAAALRLDIAPSTVGERAGQGGRFYKRLTEGKRVWPETAGKVRQEIERMLAEAGCDNSHGNGAQDFKGDAA